MKRSDLRTSAYILLCSVVLVAGVSSGPGQAKHAEQENVAVIIGNTGEQYPIYGAGGIKVSGGHHGMWTSNMKSSSIEIDGSEISAQRFLPFPKSSDFTASANSAYFVSQSSICTLPPAATGAGQEILVSNANDGTTIRYQTLNGERLFGVGPATNSTTGKVDRFISDGKDWYRE